MELAESEARVQEHQARRRVLWVCVLATLATSPGQTFLVSVFHNSLRSSLDLTATALSGAYTVGTLGSALCMTFVGRLSDHWGPRRLLLAAAFGLGIGCAWMSQVQGLIGLGLGFFLLRVCGQGSLTLASAHNLTLWFRDRLGFVEGLRNGSISVAVAVFPLATIACIEAIGWRPSFLVLGALVWLVVVPAGTFFLPERRDPRSGGKSLKQETDTLTGATLSEALKLRAYWVIAASSVASASIITAAHFHKQPLLAEAAGLSSAQAAATLVTYAIASLAATLVGGWLADRSLRAPFVLGSALLGLGSVLVLAADSVWVCHAAFGTYGVAHGWISVAIGPALARCFGRAHFGAIRGSLSTLAVAGTSLGPLVLGLSLDWGGSFRTGLFVFAALAPVLVLGSSWLQRPDTPSSDELNPR